MLANSREELVEVFDALDAELDRLDEVSFEVLTTPERLAMLERLEGLVRRLPAVGHALINQLDAQPARKNWAARCAARWPTGYASPSPTPPGASPTPPISGLVEHSPVNR
ncbi:REP13E12 repeat protein [Mycobacterium canetti]|nr:REP13E12 repeat protein [Mycobacterium canetti]